MRTFKVSTEKTFTRLLASFCSEKERDEFLREFNDLMDVVVYYRMFCTKDIYDCAEEDIGMTVGIFTLKQLESYLVFIQKNYDILQSLIRNFEYLEVSGKELTKIKKESLLDEIKERL